MEITYRFLTENDIYALKNQIVDVYRKAFAEAPYFRSEIAVLDFSSILPQQLNRKDFRMLAAQQAPGERVVGFTYGYTGEPGQWWYDHVSPRMTQEMRRSWLSGSFEIVELAVLPEAQGKGIGGELHDRILQGLPHQRAVLSTMMEDTPAFRLYEKRGWIVLLEPFIFPNVVRPYRIMGLELEKMKKKA
jgi:ribosomal protein S18 acetylase RimI-like enzyme